MSTITRNSIVHNDVIRIIVITAAIDDSDGFNNNGGLHWGRGETNPVRLCSTWHASGDIYPENLSIISF